MSTNDRDPKSHNVLSNQENHHSPSRRGFLRNVGAVSASAGLLAACGGSGSSSPRATGADSSSSGNAGRDPDPNAQPFQHGIASGDPLRIENSTASVSNVQSQMTTGTQNRIVLWTRITPTSNTPQQVEYSVATDPNMQNLVIDRASGMTDESKDYCFKVDLDLPNPATTYYYQFFNAGVASEIGRTKTAPANNDTNRYRLAVVSCSSLAHGFFNAYGHIATLADIDLVVHLGDYIYEYGTGEYGDVREYMPSHEMTTLEDYRTRHAWYRLTDNDLREAHRQHPWINTWDDHESTDNSYNDGASNHTEGAEGSWPQRKAWAIQAYHEWLPIRPLNRDGSLRSADNEIYSSPDGRIWRAFQYGQADIVMLDTRLYARTIQTQQNDRTPRPDHQLVGEEQMGWVKDTLSESKDRNANWRIIGSNVVFAQWFVSPGTSPELANRLNSDAWDGYPLEQEELMDYIRDETIGNNVVLTGDVHSTWVMDLHRHSQSPYNATTNPQGYDTTGVQVATKNSLGVEFVVDSVTSPFVAVPGGEAIGTDESINPHIKDVKFDANGWVLLDVSETEVTGEWYYVDTIATPSTNYPTAPTKVWKTVKNEDSNLPGNFAELGSQTVPASNPAELAP